jgi:hypothetical protein
MSPTWNPDQKGVKVQIVDVFSLELATGYDKDPAGRLLLSSEPSVSAGRTWTLAKGHLDKSKSQTIEVLTGL